MLKPDVWGRGGGGGGGGCCPPVKGKNASDKIEQATQIGKERTSNDGRSRDMVETVGFVVIKPSAPNHRNSIN